MSVAQAPITVRPESSCTSTSGPLVKLGAALGLNKLRMASSLRTDPKALLTSTL
jgi:hypothetical protein